MNAHAIRATDARVSVRPTADDIAARAVPLTLGGRTGLQDLSPKMVEPIISVPLSSR